MEQNYEQPHELDWDSEVEKDRGDIIQLNGDYDFIVTGFERGNFEAKPNGKLPNCKKADITLTVSLPNGQSVDVKDTLFLHSSVEWRICAFFSAIGQRKKGERIKPNWNAVLGARGRAEFFVEKRVDKTDGRTYENNKVKKYYEKAAAPDDWTEKADAAPDIGQGTPAWQQGKF